jgi:DNA-binding transcriptional LysR family regulator
MSGPVIVDYYHGMDLRSVECFLRVAETLHFARAATELHLSQPALSQRIKTLEREVGVPLLARNRRGVRLTAAGEAFIEPAHSAVQHGRHAVDIARRAASGGQGRLRLGFTVIASYTWLPRAVQEFRAACPDVTVELTEINSPGVEDALHARDIDIGILHPPLERAELQQYPLPDEPMMLALPVGHSLAGATRLTFGDLSGQPMVVAPRAVGPVLFDKLVGCFRAAGVEPAVVQEATPMTTLAGLVAAGAGIGFVTRGIASATRPGVVFCQVDGAPGVPMSAAWIGDRPPPTARRFLDVVDALV